VDARRLVAAAAARSALAQNRMREVVRAIEEGTAPVGEAVDSPDAIACRTILGTKGRRAGHVFVMGVAHERFPRIYVSRPLAFSKRYGLIARENTAGSAAQTAKFAWYYAKFGAKERFFDEERRALEYGLARASAGACATGFGKPPRWAKDGDLLARFGV
jgi:hypothetical protein